MCESITAAAVIPGNLIRNESWEVGHLAVNSVPALQAFTKNEKLASYCMS